jgi:hypothetical protein
VRPGEELALVARWSPCQAARVCGDRLCALADGEACPPDEATACQPLVGCAGAESYLYFEPEVRRSRDDGVIPYQTYNDWKDDHKTFD